MKGLKGWLLSAAFIVVVVIVAFRITAIRNFIIPPTA
jgi:hypothetical protein